MSVEETRRNTTFGLELTEAQKRRYDRRDGSLVIHIEGRHGDDVTAHVERSRE